MPHADLIHEIFRATAARNPDAPALVHAGGRLSYGELDRRSDEFAAVLAGAGIGPGNIVPVLLPPSPELVIALLAVLKRGAAYAALDGSWPAERLRAIAALLPGQPAVTGPDAGSGADAGSDADFAFAFAFAAGRIVFGGQGVGAGSGPETRDRPPALTDADSAAAMVFFTSGSTGEPKAVLSPHQATARLFAAPTFAVFDPDTVMAQIAAVPWDAFALELWGPLLTGGSCALVTERPLTPAGLRGVVAELGANTVFLTTSLFHLLVEEDPAAFAGLHTVIVGGEKLSAEHAGRFLAHWPEVRLVNGYGPVESAVFALAHRVRPADAAGEVPLGLPVPRTEVLVLRRGEQFGEVCEPGETGEICIAGDGLALGYLGDPELTAGKFVQVTVDGRRVRLYRTGDLGVLGPDGLMHFRGRLDRQVKVRGHRLEPSGIERAAAQVPGVGRCVVAVRRDPGGNALSLALFYLAEGGSTAAPTAEQLNASLRRSLPGYSVPDQVVAVPRLPLNANGKVDTAALLAAHPAPGTAVPAAVPVPAAVHGGDDGGSTEDLVAAEVSALLGLDRVDRGASVFALGATSLTAVRLCARLGSRFSLAVPVSQLMRTPTVAELAAWLDRPAPARRNDAAAAAAADSNSSDAADAAQLTPMQCSFVLQHLRSGSDLVNHCLLGWTVSGPLDPDALAEAVADVHARHGYLHARYEADEDILAVGSAGPVEFVRLTAAAPDAARQLLDALEQPFDLAQGRVWRAVLVREEGPDRWLLGVAVHHAAFDGWSQHLLSQELGLAYAARILGRTPDFAEPAPTPARILGLVEELAAAVDLDAQRDYWSSALTGTPKVGWSAPDCANGSDGPCLVELPLAAGLASALDAAVRRRGTGLLTALVTSVWSAVSAHTGQEDFAVGVPVNLRSTRELQRPVGCLIDTVCVRPRPGPGDAEGPAGVWQAVQRAVHGALANADLPIAEVVRLARPTRDRRHPLFQVMAVVQDSPVPRLELAGCRTTAAEDLDSPAAMAELTVELLAAPQTPVRLRLSRDPERVDHRTLAAVADGVLAGLSAIAAQDASQATVPDAPAAPIHRTAAQHSTAA